MLSDPNALNEVRAIPVQFVSDQDIFPTVSPFPHELEVVCTSINNP
jgi:hypothetical protein